MIDVLLHRPVADLAQFLGFEEHVTFHLQTAQVQLRQLGKGEIAHFCAGVSTDHQTKEEIIIILLPALGDVPCEGGCGKEILGHYDGIGLLAVLTVKREFLERFRQLCVHKSHNVAYLIVNFGFYRTSWRGRLSFSRSQSPAEELFFNFIGMSYWV